MIFEITFKGDFYLFITSDGVNGAISTKEQFEGSKDGYAYLGGGIIWRHREKIGTKDDIKILREFNDPGFDRIVDYFCLGQDV